MAHPDTRLAVQLRTVSWLAARREAVANNLESEVPLELHFQEIGQTWDARFFTGDALCVTEHTLFNWVFVGKRT